MNILHIFTQKKLFGYECEGQKFSYPSKWSNLIWQFEKEVGNKHATHMYSNTTIVLTKCIIKLETTYYYPLLERSSSYMGESLTLLPEQVNDAILKERLLKVRCRYYKRKWKSFHVPNSKSILIHLSFSHCWNGSFKSFDCIHFITKSRCND